MKTLLLFLLAAIPLGQDTQDESGDEQPLAKAYERYAAAPLEVRQEVLNKISSRLRKSDKEGLRALFALIDQAGAELPVVTAEEPRFHDPAVYTPGLWPRRFADKEDSGIKMQAEVFRPWESDPPYVARILYDFGKNEGVSIASEMPSEEAVWNLLYGYLPDTDLLVAWTLQKLDHDEEVDSLARHFDLAYCDLAGNAFEEVTIYDAYASGESMDMSDVDVIAFARRILNDDSYVSPIPAGQQRARLYDETRKGFLRYFQHRTFIEAIANLYVNPEAPLREAHEPLRNRILYMLAVDEGDFDRIRKRLVDAGTRNGVIGEIDLLMQEDPAWNDKVQKFTSSTNEVRWAAALAVQAVLQEEGFFPDGDIAARDAIAQETEDQGTEVDGSLRIDDVFKDVEWRSIGPVNMGGRIVDIAVDPRRKSTFYLASASGGLFKTVNNGTTFKALFQQEGSISIGDVCVAPSNPAIVWVGTGEANARNSVTWGDGVYVSDDGGETWTHRGLEDTRHVGRIAIHPHDPQIVYVAAMGHTWGPNPERGLYRTSDGGKTWDRVLHVDDNTGCIDVVLHPDQPGVIYAATYERQRDSFDGGDPATRFGPGSGLWRSKDGGETWERLKNGLPTHPLGRIGLDLYGADPRVLFAIIETELTGQRVPGQDDEGRAFMGVRGRNHESGFELIEVQEDQPAAKAGLKTGDIVYRIEERSIQGFADLLSTLEAHRPGESAAITVLRDSQEMTVTIQFGESTRGPGFNRGSQGGQTANVQGRQGGQGIESGGIFRSDDGGDTWKRINSLNPRPFYYSQVRVDPSSDQNIYVLGISMHYSSNGGLEFDDRAGRGAHPDHHALWIDPDDSDHLILGGDGGLYVTHDRCQTWDFVEMLPIGQFYNVAVDMRQPYHVYGGLQDNGCWGGPSASCRSQGVGPEDWVQINGGDGFHCAADPTDPDFVYCESQNGAMVRRNLRTGEMRMVQRSTRGQRFNWNTPFILSPHNPHTLYFAGSAVFRSVDRGGTSRSISPEITRTDRGSATALAESPRVEGVLYVGMDDGALWISRDGGANWKDLHESLPELETAKYVSDIEPSLYQNGTVYVTLDGHRSDDYASYVFRSDDFGETWTSLVKGLPEASVRCIVEDLENQDLLFTGTEVGCFVSINGGERFTPFKGNLPTVPVHDLVIHPRDGELVAGTHGRGIWIADIAPFRELDADVLSVAAHLFRVKPVYLWHSRPSSGSYGARRFHATEPPNGAVISYLLGADRDEEVNLVISDVLGEEVRTLRGPGVKGLHRVVFDLSRRRAGGRGQQQRMMGRRGAARVEAGDYVVTLTVGDSTLSRRIRVFPDPETQAPADITSRNR